MTPTEFLAKRVPGYSNLAQEDHEAIQAFSLLWPAFEGAVLATAASPAKLVSLAFRLRDLGLLDITRFEAPLAYFRARYWREGEFTYEFSGLHIEKNSLLHQQHIKQTLDGTPLKPEIVLGGLLLIVLRLRNNLFHGVKWAYGIRGQKANFENACAILMSVMDTAPPLDQ